jgi:hypothetical protein
MTIRQPRYSKEEFAQRGHELYETQIRAKVEKRQFKSEVHQRLIYLNRILQMVFYSQATFSVYC